MKNGNQSTAILAAIGKRGETATLTTATDFEAIKAQIGGTVTGISLDKSTAVFYNRDAQTATLIDPYSLDGTLALCGVGRSGEPASLSTIKQVTKYAKVFKARAVKTETAADPRKEVI